MPCIHSAHALHVPGGFIARKGDYTTCDTTYYPVHHVLLTTLLTAYQAFSLRTRITRASRC